MNDGKQSHTDAQRNNRTEKLLMISRRRVLSSLSLGSIAVSNSWTMQFFAAEQAQNELRIPNLETGQTIDDKRSFQLTLQQGTSNFLPGLSTETLGINGSYLGPTLLFKRNEQVNLNVKNEIGEASTLHWHGVHLPATEDGGPHQVIAHGDTWNPSFEVVQFAGTFWYHSHMEQKSGEQVYKGLAGMIIIEDEEQEVDLPNNYGVDDIPLIVQDRRFNEDGSFSYVDNYDDMVIGAHGTEVLVNGTHRPAFSPSTKLVRFRILNAANARTFNFALSDGRTFRQIASDGGLLESAVTLSNLILAPAERAEILVEFSAEETVNLVSLERESNFPQFAGAMSRLMRNLNTQALQILSIQPSSQLQASPEVPAELASIYRLPIAASQNTRRFQLSMGAGMRSGNDAGPGTGLRSGLGGGHGGGNFSINGRRMDMNFINERITLNTTEIWEVTNNSPMMHPFHVHNGQFQILDRNGNPPPANEMGWKDTVRVGSGELVRIIMRFTDFVDEDNPYMYHCHILEHEDRGMMGQFVVV